MMTINISGVMFILLTLSLLVFSFCSGMLIGGFNEHEKCQKSIGDKSE